MGMRVGTEPSTTMTHTSALFDAQLVVQTPTYGISGVGCTGSLTRPRRISHMLPLRMDDQLRKDSKIRNGLTCEIGPGFKAWQFGCLDCGADARAVLKGQFSKIGLCNSLRHLTRHLGPRRYTARPFSLAASAGSRRW